MDATQARELFVSGAKLVLLDFPQGSTFGMDYCSWTTGPKFKGIKLVPPGLHFVYYSIASTGDVRIGFWWLAKPGEVAVYKWNSEDGDVIAEQDKDQVERIKLNIRDFDSSLGPYPWKPLDSNPLRTEVSMASNDTNVHEDDPYSKWRRLTPNISETVLNRVLSKSNWKVSSVESTSHFTQVVDERLEEGAGRRWDRHGTTSTVDQEVVEGLRRAREKNQIEFASFNIKQSYPPNATAVERSQWSMDKSWLLRHILQHQFNNDPMLLLGECELSFVLFLIGHIFDGFESWKHLMELLCQCDVAMSDPALTTFWEKWIESLSYQIEDVPDDFFIDALSEGNFMETMFRSLALNTISPSASSIPKSIKQRARHLFSVINKRFKWDIRAEIKREQEVKTHYDEDDEYAPVVVELGDAMDVGE